MSGEPLYVLSGDVDGDGFADLVTVNEQTGGSAPVLDSAMLGSSSAAPARRAAGPLPTNDVSVLLNAFAPPCPGDASGDDQVDLTDLNLVLFNFGNAVAPGTNGDVNDSGSVDLADLNLVLFNFGSNC